MGALGASLQRKESAAPAFLSVPFLWLAFLQKTLQLVARERPTGFAPPK
jgi:hypothetical protein